MGSVSQVKGYIKLKLRNVVLTEDFRENIIEYIEII